jgi:hypothetical protein
MDTIYAIKTNERTVQVGVDFQDVFANERYAERHVEGLNAYDPESFITGTEIAAGKTYRDKRNYESIAYYQAVRAQKISLDITLAPR